MSLKNMLNEMSQTQKTIHCMIPFTGSFQNRQIPRDRELVLAPEAGGGEPVLERDGASVGGRSGGQWRLGLYNHVNVLHVQLKVVKMAKLC